MADVELRGHERAADRLRLADDPQLHPDRHPHRPGAAGTDSGCAVIWLAASVMP